LLERKTRNSGMGNRREKEGGGRTLIGAPLSLAGRKEAEQGMDLFSEGKTDSNFHWPRPPLKGASFSKMER
jgi:hypothetical protein